MSDLSETTPVIHLLYIGIPHEFSPSLSWAATRMDVHLELHELIIIECGLNTMSMASLGLLPCTDYQAITHRN